MESREAADVGRFRAAFIAERERLIARRLPFAGRFFLMSVGIAAVGDAAMHPERTVLLLGVYLTQLVVCIAAVFLVRRGGPLAPSRVAAASAILVTGLAIAYLVRIGASPDRIGMVLVCLLGGSSLLLPWGGGVQAVVSAAICAAFVLLVPVTASASQLGSIWLPAVVVAVLSYAGARHVDRYREDAFERASLEAEEARTTAALARVGETLHVHLQEPDLLDRVCRVARDELPCDWTALYMLDEADGRHRLRGFAGPPGAPGRDALADYAPTDEELPLLDELRRTDLVEIRDARRQTLIPASLVERFRIGAALYTPVRRNGRVVGSIAYGFVGPRPGFTSLQRRLVIGVAHVTAVAVENLRLIDQLAAASRLKSEFVATMSHELRTPLSVIGGYVDLLDEGLFGPVSDQQRDTLGRIRQSSFALLELVNMTLDLGRLESGRETVSPSIVAVHDLAEEVRGEQAATVPVGVRHRWDYDLDLEVHVDRAKLKTILKNLVGNALKFTTSGRVDVRIVWHDDVLRVDVEDTGIGIAAADLEVVFEMFRQADGSSTRRYDGVGLGLHIVKRLTALLGGTIEVESEPGRGSTFRVRLPCPRAGAAARRSA